MKQSRFHWPAPGLMAGALCLALSSGAAVAHPHEGNKNDAGNTDRTERIDRAQAGEEAQLRGGYLGVRVQDITRELQKARDLASTEGAMVNRVEPGSPADQVGLRRGDVIVRLEGEEIENAEELIRAMGDRKPGDRVKVVVVREGTRKTFTVKLGERPRPAFGEMPRMHDRWLEAFEGLPMEERIQRLDRLERELQRIQDEIRALRQELRERGDRDDRDDAGGDEDEGRGDRTTD